jgi:hypothetical protein
MSILTPRSTRILAGFAVMSAFAIAPMAAQAADTPVTGDLDAGVLANTAPTITPFAATLTGIAQTRNTEVGSWTVTDASATNAGYAVTVAASAPVVTVPDDGDTTDPDTDPDVVSSGTGGAIELLPSAAQAVGGNANTAPDAKTVQVLTTTPATINNAIVGTGQGPWSFTADTDDPTGAAGSLHVLIPRNIHFGDYSRTLTFTTAAPGL